MTLKHANGTQITMIPNNLKAWRMENGYSQSQLAKVLGVAPMTVNRWETGLRQIPSFLHLALECLKMKGNECSAGIIAHKPGRYLYLPLNDRILIDKEEIVIVKTKKKTKKKRS